MYAITPMNSLRVRLRLLAHSLWFVFVRFWLFTKVKCPHYKLVWFKKCQYSMPEIEQVKVLVNAAFKYTTNTWSVNNSGISPGNDVNGVQAGEVSGLCRLCLLYATYFLDF
jgi:hypothetical protein